MSIKPTRMQFNGGELSPWLQGRTDIAKYDKTAKLCRNFIPLVEGSLKRRGGTHFVAQTPQDDDILFQILPTPVEAKVLINGVERSSITVTRGDKLYYEVSCDGFSSSSGNYVVLEDTNLEVFLVSKSELFTFTIQTEPSDATVLLNGYQRRSIKVFKNSTVEYQVYKDGYILQSGSVVVQDNQTLTVTLQQDEQTLIDYGDWGTLEKFVGCTVFLYNHRFYRSWTIKFSNGYLGVVLDYSQIAPDESYVLDESLFFKSNYDLYNAVVIAYGIYQVCVAVKGAADDVIMLWYYDENNECIGGIDVFSADIAGWPRDEDDKYITQINDYVGVVSGNVLKVYYQGNLVWELKGRNNV